MVTGLNRVGVLARSGPQPRIVGDAVSLRPPRAEDFSEWCDLRRASRDFLRAWEPSWSIDHLDRSAFRRRLKRYGEEMAAGRALPLFIFAREGEAERLVGGLTLSGVRRGAAQTGALGYWIGEAYQRRGFMREALGLLTAHAFGELGLHRLEAASLPDNIASRRLLEVCGFQEEGLCRGYIKIAGVWRDHILYARLSGDPAP